MFSVRGRVPSVGRPAATEPQRQEQRSRIRRAAAEIYQEGGTPALSVRAIARRAGVSTGLLYSYFDDLSDLLRSLWMRPVAEFGREVDGIAAAHADPIARIEALLRAYVAWAHDHPDVYRGVLLFVRPPTSRSPEPQPLDELSLHRALRTAIEQGQAQGVVSAGDPAELAQVLWSGVHGALALPVNIDGYAIAPSTELAPAMIAALVRSIASPSPHEERT